MLQIAKELPHGIARQCVELVSAIGCRPAPVRGDRPRVAPGFRLCCYAVRVRSVRNHSRSVRRRAHTPRPSQRSVKICLSGRILLVPLHPPESHAPRQGKIGEGELPVECPVLLRSIPLRSGEGILRSLSVLLVSEHSGRTQCTESVEPAAAKELPETPSAVVVRQHGQRSEAGKETSVVCSYPAKTHRVGDSSSLLGTEHSPEQTTRHSLLLTRSIIIRIRHYLPPPFPPESVSVVDVPDPP